MSTISNSLSSQANPTASPAANSSLTSKDTFLKLLVAQLKNQDPTNPTDSTQFVGQLTQYSELEQLIGINTGVGKLGTTPSTGTTTTPTKPTAI